MLRIDGAQRAAALQQLIDQRAARDKRLLVGERNRLFAFQRAYHRAQANHAHDGDYDYIRIAARQLGNRIVAAANVRLRRVAFKLGVFVSIRNAQQPAIEFRGERGKRARIRPARQRNDLVFVAVSPNYVEGLRAYRARTPQYCQLFHVKSST